MFATNGHKKFGCLFFGSPHGAGTHRSDDFDLLGDQRGSDNNISTWFMFFGVVCSGERSIRALRESKFIDQSRVVEFYT